MGSTKLTLIPPTHTVHHFKQDGLSIHSYQMWICPNLLCCFLTTFQDIGHHYLQVQGNTASTVSRKSTAAVIPPVHVDCGCCSNFSVRCHWYPLDVPQQPYQELLPHPHRQHLHPTLPPCSFWPLHLCPRCNPQWLK